jgi:hypothetical protein
VIVQDAASAPWVDAHARPLVRAVPVAGVALAIAVAAWLQRRRGGAAR